MKWSWFSPPGAFPWRTSIRRARMDPLRPPNWCGNKSSGEDPEFTVLKPNLKHSQVVGGHLVVEDATSPTWSLSFL